MLFVHLSMFANNTIFKLYLDIVGEGESLNKIEQEPISRYECCIRLT